jgi:hypothetical protein
MRPIDWNGTVKRGRFCSWAVAPYKLLRYEDSISRCSHGHDDERETSANYTLTAIKIAAFRTIATERTCVSNLISSCMGSIFIPIFLATMQDVRYSTFSSQIFLYLTSTIGEKYCFVDHPTLFITMNKRNRKEKAENCLDVIVT